MNNRPGVHIESIHAGSPAERTGIRQGDVLISLNGHKIFDVIDYMFAKDNTTLDMAVLRGGKKLSFRIETGAGEDPGIELKQFKVQTCRNNCIFCFVSQLPRGLRKSLYVRDDDYRMSFLYGNYITMTGLSAEDKKRIVRQRLSPLYISVHSTDKSLRAKMLGNPKTPDIMKELGFLKENNIHMHAQIVLCPSFNDGRELEKTIKDLYSFYPQLQSIAVVPVGITSKKKAFIEPVDKDDAAGALDIIDKFQKRFRKKHGDSIVCGSDELYIKAERPFPPLGDYGDLPQIENGVGMVQSFMSQAKKIKAVKKIKAGTRYLTFTGISFYPFISRFLEKLTNQGIDVTVVPVENTFFGRSVTVTGLLTGRDIIKSLQYTAEKYDCLLIPDVVLKEADNVFLDDVSVEDIGNALDIKPIIIPSTPDGMLEALQSK